MQWLRVLGVLCVTGSFAAGCATGKDVKSAGKEDKLAYDESGKGKKCDNPKSSCEEISDPSLDFKEKCREAGFRMKQCGCDNLCSGNINGQRVGFNSKNQQNICKETTDKCETPETSAAYQDACDGVGGEMMECGCEWLCSKKLKEAIADAPKDDDKKPDDAAADAAADDSKKKEQTHGNMDGKSPEQAAKDKSSKDKSSTGKSKKDSSSSTSSSSSSTSSSGKKKTGRFLDPEQ